jgi:hypothetical protein
VFRRLSSQRSHFSVFGSRPNGLAELRSRDDHLLEKIAIPPDAIAAIRDQLYLSGISEATILQALSRELEPL